MEGTTSEVTGETLNHVAEEGQRFMAGIKDKVIGPSKKRGI